VIGLWAHRRDPEAGEKPTALELAHHEPISEAIIPMRVGWWIWPHDRYCRDGTTRAIIMRQAPG